MVALELPASVESPLLLLGDCLDVLARLPAESVDVVITDPPAGIGAEREVLGVRLSAGGRSGVELGPPRRHARGHPQRAPDPKKREPALLARPPRQAPRADRAPAK